jgi:hypothetical protein
MPVNGDTTRQFGALKQSVPGLGASIKDLSKKHYSLENMYLSIYISGYFYV